MAACEKVTSNLVFARLSGILHHLQLASHDRNIAQNVTKIENINSLKNTLIRKQTHTPHILYERTYTTGRKNSHIFPKLFSENLRKKIPILFGKRVIFYARFQKKCLENMFNLFYLSRILQFVYLSQNYQQNSNRRTRSHQGGLPYTSESV